MEKPRVKKFIEAGDIVSAAQDHLDFYDSEDFHEDRINDYEGYLVDAVMKAVFGDNVYDWINSQWD